MSYVKIYEKIDKNKDGKISFDEFSQWILRALSPFQTFEKIDNMFKKLDVDGDGQIDVIEFAQLFVDDIDEEYEVILQNSFDMYDFDCDGKISAGDFHVVSNLTGDGKSMDEWVAKVGAIDADGDGFLNFEEFKIMTTLNKFL